MLLRFLTNETLNHKCLHYIVLYFFSYTSLLRLLFYLFEYLIRNNKTNQIICNFRGSPRRNYGNSSKETRRSHPFGWIVRWLATTKWRALRGGMNFFLIHKNPMGFEPTLSRELVLWDVSHWVVVLSEYKYGCLIKLLIKITVYIK